MALDAFLFGPLIPPPAPRKKKNRGDKRAQKKRRRARDKGAPIATLTGREWVLILQRFGHTCAYCPEPATTQDHATPLSRGGSHDRTNVVPACLSCNSSKQDLTAGEFFEKRLRERMPA